MFKERLILAIPSGPQVPGQPRHSEGSRLAVPTHSFLRNGIGWDYILDGYFSYVEGDPMEIAEFRGADIPKVVAENRAHVGIVGLDHVLNLPDEDLEHIEILRKLGYGKCEFRLGVPKDLGYSKDSKLEDVAGLRVATALPVVAMRKFQERRVSVTIVPMDGHVENAYRYKMADAIVDITQSGGTMDRNGLTPAESLESFEAVLIGNKYPLIGRERIKNKLLTSVDRALRNPSTWMIQETPTTNTNSISTNGHIQVIEEQSHQSAVI